MGQAHIFRGTIPNDGTGDTAYVFTGKAENNFNELYAAIVTPTILMNFTGTFTQGIPVKTWVEKLIVVPQIGSPSIKIGITEGGNEILDTTVIGDSLPVFIQQYYPTGKTLYFVVSGGNVNINFDQKNPIFP
jgi:hypothetical protein